MGRGEEEEEEKAPMGVPQSGGGRGGRRIPHTVRFRMALPGLDDTPIGYTNNKMAVGDGIKSGLSIRDVHSETTTDGQQK